MVWRNALTFPKVEDRAWHQVTTPGPEGPKDGPWIAPDHRPHPRAYPSDAVQDNIFHALVTLKSVTGERGRLNIIKKHQVICRRG